MTVPVKVSDFANVGAMQFSIGWDPAVLEYKSLQDFDYSGFNITDLVFFGESKFNLDFVGDGKLNLVFEHPNASDAAIADDETIFSITFDVIGGDGSSTAVSFTDVPTPRKLATFSTKAQNPEFVSQNGSIQIDTAALKTSLIRTWINLT